MYKLAGILLLLSPLFAILAFHAWYGDGGYVPTSSPRPAITADWQTPSGGCYILAGDPGHAHCFVGGPNQ